MLFPISFCVVWRNKLSSMVFMFDIKFLNYNCDIALIFPIKQLISSLYTAYLAFCTLILLLLFLHWREKIFGCKEIQILRESQMEVQESVPEGYIVACRMNTDTGFRGGGRMKIKNEQPSSK